VQLHRAREQFAQQGAKLVLIGQATPRHAAHFRRTRKIDLPVLADESRQTYKLIGAKKGSVGELIGPKIVARGALTTLRTGQMQGRTIGHPAQLGGALVVAPGGEVAFKHLASDASDNVTPEQLLEVLRGLG
jgi:prostamide/prostaglandin F2alpha synthase